MAGNKNRGGGGLVYHWRHGWIPRTPTAALQKAHGSHKGAEKIMKKHGVEGSLPGKKADAPSTAKIAHAAPHTLKVGDKATVHGVDDSGAPIQFTGEVRGRTAVTMAKGGKKTPMLGITVKRESATTGGMRHDTVYVPDPDRDPGKIQAARAAGSARDTLRRDLMAKYRGQGSSYKQQTRGIDPEVMSDGDLKKLRDSLHAEPDAAMLEEGRKLRADVDAEFTKRQSAPSTTTGPKASAGDRAKVRDLPAEGTFSRSHSETFMGEKITVRKTETGRHETLINGEPFSAGYGSRNKDAVTALDQARKSIETMKSSSDPKYRGLYGMKPGTSQASAPKAPAATKRVEIEHSGDGTTLSIERGDTEAREAVKAAGFRWSSNLGAWYLPRTQHESTRRAKIAQLQRKLGDGDVGVSDGGRGKTTTAAEREAASRASATARADRMDTRAAKLSAESEARRKASDAITEHIPMGQPILVGHHSQRRHERALERAHGNDRASWDAAAESKRASEAADRARKTAAGETPLARQRRIDRNEAEIRKIDRELSDHQLASKVPENSPIAGRVAHMRASQNRLDQLTARRAELADQVSHDKQQITESGIKQVTSKDVTAGDMVTYRGRTYLVTKVNKTTVSVPSGYSWDDKIPLNQVQRHVPLSTQSDSAVKTAFDRATDPKVKNALRNELLRRGLSAA